MYLKITILWVLVLFFGFIGTTIPNHDLKIIFLILQVVCFLAQMLLSVFFLLGRNNHFHE
jgi:hypothetical protein